MIARKTLIFTDSDTIQHAIPAGLVNDIQCDKNNVTTVILSGGVKYTVASPSYVELVTGFQSLPDTTTAYL